MQVGDLVTIVTHGSLAMSADEQPFGILTCFDPEEIRDMDEVEVVWTRNWTGASNHSVWNLEVVNGS